MRIREVHIDGYGRLSDCAMRFEPGLQILVGPNERGKSTLRCFISDMLYGQRRDGPRGGYEESNALRLPWTRPEVYGGRIVYELGGGAAYEVRRTFHQGREETNVIDLASGAGITDSFPRLSNGENAFSEIHLGAGKSVFLGAATIGHLSLDGLGDSDALSMIRDRLLTVTDSGTGARSADAALRALTARIEAVGAPDARHRPLPALTARLAELREEKSLVREARRRQAELERAVVALRAEVAACEADLARNQDELARARWRRRVARLQELDRIQGRIDEITQQCFLLGPDRDIPLEGLAEAQHALMLSETARLQVERGEKDGAALGEELRRYTEIAGIDPERMPAPVPEETERRYHQLTGEEERLTERVAEAGARLHQVEEQIVATQQRLAELPDFSREAPDPVEWLTQLVSSFDTSVRTMEEQRRKREQLREEAQRRQEELAGDTELFKECESFSERLREFEEGRKKAEEKRIEVDNRIHNMRGARDDLQDRIPGLLWLSGFCGAFLAVLCGVFLFTGKAPVLYAGCIILLATAYFLFHLYTIRRRVLRMTKQIAESQADMDMLDTGDKGLSPVEALLKSAECETLRELEARYDRYRELTLQYAACQRDLDHMEQATKESEQRVPRLFDCITESLLRVGETVRDEYDVQNAAGRVISRFQEYREAKRRMADHRNAMQASIERLREQQAALAANREARADVEAQISGIMCDCGYAAMLSGGDVLSALRGYNGYIARIQGERSRLETLRSQYDTAMDQLTLDRQDDQRRRQELNALLAGAGVASVEEWQARSEKARQYRSLQETRLALEEQAAVLLEQESLAELRLAVEAGEDEGLSSPAPEATVEALEETGRWLTARLDGLRREELAIQASSGDAAMGLRPPAEVEEELVLVAARAEALQQEFDALVHTAALIEDAASTRHARIAPALARDASGFLGRITLGAHPEMRLGPDFSISLRSTGDGSEKGLSKGALDQVYLALRLALVRCLSRKGEALPMLLDDPFANYDDGRLRAALALLQEVGQEHQVMLFSCREDVAEAALAINAPVLYL